MLYTKNANVTTTAESTLVTVPSGYVAHWNMLFVVNLGGSTDGASVYVDKWDAVNEDYTSIPDIYILGGGNISSKEYVLLSDGVFVLQEKDKVVVSTTSAGNMEFVITFDLLEQAPTFVNFNGS